MFTEFDVVSLFSKINYKHFTEQTQIPGYVLVPVSRGSKIRISFDDRDVYLIFADDSLPLFCRNHYLGGVHVEHRYDAKRIKVQWTITRTFLIRANAAVVSNRGSAGIITPVDQNADIIFSANDRFSCKCLEDHFRDKYRDLRPELFAENVARLKTMNLRLELTKDGIIAVSY